MSTSSPVFEDEARQVIGKAPAGFIVISFLTMLEIISIILSLIKVIQGCKQKHSDLASTARTRRARRIISEAIISKVGPNKAMARATEVEQMTDAFIARAGDIDEETFNKLLEEAGNDRNS